MQLLRSGQLVYALRRTASFSFRKPAWALGRNGSMRSSTGYAAAFGSRTSTCNTAFDSANWFAQHCPCAHAQVLSVVERNLTSNEVLIEEDVFQNCVTVHAADSDAWYEQVESCQSVTHPDLRYLPIIRVAKRDVVSHLTSERIPMGSVLIMYNLSWPVEDDEVRDSRVVLQSDLRFNLPTSLSDLFYLGARVCFGRIVAAASHRNMTARRREHVSSRS